jgi:purine-cytosine permease-like protein
MSLRRRPRLHHRGLPRIGELALCILAAERHQPSLVLAFALILWLQAGDRATRFQDAVLLVSYWIPAFVAVVVIDWLIRTRARPSTRPKSRLTASTPLLR